MEKSEQKLLAYKKENKYQFPSEIVELPSKGLVYPKENPLSSGKIEMKL